jgi:hypothetical protein
MTEIAYCINCQKFVDSDGACPDCGSDLYNIPQKKTPTTPVNEDEEAGNGIFGLIMIIAFAVVFVAGIILGIMVH